MGPELQSIIARVESLMARIESVLPQALSAPDWATSTAFRYRKRSNGHGALEPLRVNRGPLRRCLGFAE